MGGAVLAILAAVGCAGDDKDSASAPVPAPIDTDTDTGGDVAAPPGVDADGDGFIADADCDDTDAAVYPGAPDVCGDDRSTDCARSSDDGLITVLSLIHI